MESQVFIRCIAVVLPIVVSSMALGQSRPWEQQDRVVAAGLENSPQWFALVGLDESQFAQLPDREELDEAARRVLYRLLYRMDHVPWNQVERWLQSAPSLESIVADPSRYRGAICRLAGRLGSVSEELLPDAVGDQLQFRRFQRVVLRVAGTDTDVEVAARAVPSQWSPGGAVGEPVGVTGFFAYLTEDERPCFVADRVAWYPTRPAQGLGVGVDQVTLAAWGLDIGLLNEVRDRESFERADSLCFYQLMMVIEQHLEEFRERENSPWELDPLLVDPERNHGRLTTLRGMVKRVTRIVVGDAGVQQRFGIDDYYQLDMRVSLGRQQVRLGKSTEGDPAPTFVNSFPVVVCVRRLPAWLPEGETLRKEIELPVVFFKLWAHSSQFVSGRDRRQRQLTPMLIGGEPKPVAHPPVAGPYFTFAVGAGFLGFLGGLWLLQRRFLREDAELARIRRRVIAADDPGNGEC